MKKLILSVSCANSKFEDRPDHYIVSLSDADIKKIKEVSALVNRHNLKLASADFFSGEFFSAITMTDITDEYDIAESMITEDMVSNFHCDNSQVESRCFVTDGSQVWFTCIPKYADESELCSTTVIQLSDLDK